MSRDKFDISAYLVIGPENTMNRPVVPIIKDAIDSGFTCIQIRSKTASARELIDITCQTSDLIKKLGKEEEVTLLVDDRLDVVLSARRLGAKVDGIHVGQTDIPVNICREYLGEDAIIGLSARTDELFDYIKNVDVSNIDYFGIGPLYETETKKDCGVSKTGQVITRSYEEVKRLVQLSSIPMVIGGGVKLEHISQLIKTGVDGFFVVSAFTQAKNPEIAARDLVNSWNESR